MITEHCGDNMADELPLTEQPAYVEASLAFFHGTPQINRTAATEEFHEFIAEHDGEESSNVGEMRVRADKELQSADEEVLLQGQHGRIMINTSVLLRVFLSNNLSHLKKPTRVNTLPDAEVAFRNQNSGFLEDHLSSENPEQIIIVNSEEGGTGLYGSVLKTVPTGGSTAQHLRSHVAQCVGKDQVARLLLKTSST